MNKICSKSYVIDDFATNGFKKSPAWVRRVRDFSARLEAMPTLFRGGGHEYEGRYAFGLTPTLVDEIDAIAKNADLASLIKESSWTAAAPIFDLWRTSQGAYMLWTSWKSKPDEQAQFDGQEALWIHYRAILKPPRLPHTDVQGWSMSLTTETDRFEIVYANGATSESTS